MIAASNDGKHLYANDWLEHYDKQYEKGISFVMEKLCWVHVLVSSHNWLRASFWRSFLKNLSLPNEVNFRVIPSVVAKDLSMCILDLGTGSVGGVSVRPLPNDGGAGSVREPVSRML